MPRAEVYKKRPCRICRRWFMPNPRLKDRQKTCGDAACKREWHRRKCAQWNKNNSDYFKANYLQSKLNPENAKALQPTSRLKSGLPLGYVQEVISVQHLIIIEYFGQLLFRRFQAAIRGQVVVNTGQRRQLPPGGLSRCDRH
jgi:hypothetical protein